MHSSPRRSISCANNDLRARRRFLISVFDSRFPLAQYGYTRRRLGMGYCWACKNAVGEFLRDGSQMIADLIKRDIIGHLVHTHRDGAPCSRQKKVMMDLLLVESHCQIAAPVHFGVMAHLFQMFF